MPSIFTRIVAREIPAHILHEDSDFLAFLDIRPIREGHTLVISKAEVPDLFDLPGVAACRSCCRSQGRSRQRFNR